MKKIIVLFAVLIIFANSTLIIEDCKSQWVQMSNGMGTDKPICSFLVNGNSIFAGTQSYGVYVTTNYGINWAPSGLNYQWVNALVVSGNNIFAGTISHGVWLSTDNGGSWFITSMNNANILSLAVSGNSIFAGQFIYGVYRSTNNGTNWIQSGLSNKDVRCLAIDGNSIYAATDSSVFLSTNNGTNWNQTTLSGQFIHTLVMLGGSVFAGTENGVYRTANNGANWTQNGLSGHVINSLTTFGNNIFAGTSFGGYYYVFLSTNNGANWLNKTQGFNPVPIITELLITNNYIFAGTYGTSVWRRDYLEIIGIKQISSDIPSSYSLSQNYPNPFNPATIIKFKIPMDSGLRRNDKVILKVYNIVGREIATLVNEKLNPGTYEVPFSVSGLSGNQMTSGVYFYRLTAGGYSETKKMVLLK